MAYWAVARLQPFRERIALHCLALRGFTIYLPRLRTERILHGRRLEAQRSMFPGYVFVRIEMQWSGAHWGPGVIGLIMNGSTGGPARVPESIVDEIRAREVDGLVELPKPRPPRRGDRVKVQHGPFAGRFAIFATLKPHQRVEVLLALLGSQQRVILPRAHTEGPVIS